MTKEEIISAIENMTVLELSELVKELQDRFGVTAAARSYGRGSAAGGAAEAAEAEQTEVM